MFLLSISLASQSCPITWIKLQICCLTFCIFVDLYALEAQIIEDLAYNQILLEVFVDILFLYGHVCNKVKHRAEQSLV